MSKKETLNEQLRKATSSGRAEREREAQKAQKAKPTRTPPKVRYDKHGRPKIR